MGRSQNRYAPKKGRRYQKEDWCVYREDLAFVDARIIFTLPIQNTNFWSTFFFHVSTLGNLSPVTLQQAVHLSTTKFPSLSSCPGWYYLSALPAYKQIFLTLPSVQTKALLKLGGKHWGKVLESILLFTIKELWVWGTNCVFREESNQLCIFHWGKAMCYCVRSLRSQDYRGFISSFQ